MNKNEFIKALSISTNLTKKECKRILDEEISIICRALKTGNVLDFKNFGKIFVKTKKEHFCKINGKIYLIGQKNEVELKLYKNFKNIVK